MARIDQVIPKTTRRETAVQFGGGGFLRGFFDWMLQVANDAGVYDGSVVVVQSTPRGVADALKRQNGQYTQILRGAEGVKACPIDVVSRCVKAYEDFPAFLALAEVPTLRLIVSNTTEAGIRFEPGEPMASPKSFPARLAALLYHRHQLGLPGFLILPCELIEENGRTLKEYVLRHARSWGLGEGFFQFVERDNHFLNTLVDRINTGYPAGEAIDLGYADELVNCCEWYHLWVIEGDGALAAEMPFDRAGLNVRWVDDLAPYRTRKVRILNGAHTATVALAMLAGVETVGEAVADPEIGAFMRRTVFEEIIPTLDLPGEELKEYAEGVFRRFQNPFIRHEWRAISLNSVSKFRVRVLPSILEYERRFGRLPPNLIRSLAKLIELYRGFDVRDEPQTIAAMRRSSVREVLSDEALWGEDIRRLSAAVEENITTRSEGRA